MTTTISAPDGDISPGFDTVTGVEAVRQRVQQRLRLLRGEWFLDASAGIPYLQGILAQPSGAGLAGQVVAAEILDVEGVAGVRDVVAEFDTATRRLQFSANVETPDGTTSVAVEL